EDKDYEEFRDRERPMSALIRTLGLVCLLVSLSGCSVVLALVGTKEPNLAKLHAGSTREEVETELGKPVESHPTDWGAQTDVYEYEADNAPNRSRAAANFMTDLA